MKTYSKRVLLVAGDPSGDAHAAALAESLRKKIPHIHISALGGKHLQKVADEFIFPLVGIGGFGFIEPLIKLPRLLEAFASVKKVIATQKIDAVIPVDYYGFNIHVARFAHKKGIPVIYYVSPQVWASRPKRAQELAKVVQRMLVIFPFEVAWYAKKGVSATFVGHPLLDSIEAPGEPVTPPQIGLFPGSRASVVRKHLPILIATAERIRKDLPAADFILFQSDNLEQSIYEDLRRTPWIHAVRDSGYIERRKLSLAITVSGTASLENMLLGIPMIIMYRLSAPTYWIAKRLVRVPFIGIPNILADKAIVPEFLQTRATPEHLSKAAIDLLNDPNRRSSMRADLLSLRVALSHGGASDNAAREIAAVIGATA